MMIDLVGWDLICHAGMVIGVLECGVMCERFGG